MAVCCDSFLLPAPLLTSRGRQRRRSLSRVWQVCVRGRRGTVRHRGVPSPHPAWSSFVPECCVMSSEQVSTLVNRISALIKKKHWRPPSPLPPYDDMSRRQPPGTWRGHSPEHAGTFIWDLEPPELWEIDFSIDKPPNLCYSVIDTAERS